MSDKFTPENFSDMIMNYINQSLIDKANELSTDQVTAYFDGSNIVMKFNKELSEDALQDKNKVLINGGVFMTKEGAEKIKNGSKLSKDDIIFINPIGDKL